MLGFSENESSSDFGHESSDEVDWSTCSTNENKAIEKNRNGGADDNDATEQCQEDESGNAFDSHPGTAMEAYDSSSSEDTGPYWNTFKCAPYYEPTD